MKASRKWLSLTLAAALMAAPISAFADVTATTKPASTQQIATLAVGQVYEGFKLTKKSWSEEASSNVYFFAHEKSGGQVVYFENNDRHKAFDIVFKTPVFNDTGVNHILEHGLLSGSEKYPSKSPFMTMSQTSVNTFANAMTYPDKTAFPFSSQNDKDFQNLMNVYMDAVFAPKIVKDPNLFKREGWGYDYDAKTNQFSYKGIVYSEMKGAMSEPSAIQYRAYGKYLFPNSGFAYNSGGEPESIVKLSHQGLVDTYTKYYHPSNALISLYGKMDIKEKLKFINKEYFGKYTKKAVKVDYGSLKPFTKTQNARVKYHVDPGTDLKGKTMLTVGYGFQGASKKDLLALSVLTTLMANLEISPMKQAFNETGFGQSFSANTHIENRATSVEFTVSDSDPKNKAAFEAFIQKQLTEIAKKGLDKELIESALNSVELTNRLGKLSANKGNGLREGLEIGFVTYNDPMYLFDTDAVMNEIKKEALNKQYFEKLIEKYMLKNTHKLVLSVEPQVNLNAVADQKQAAALAQFKSKLSKKALTDVKASIAAFEKWKNEPDKPADLAKLPQLSLKDLTYSVPRGNMTLKTVSDVPVVENVGNTNKTLEVKYLFSLASLSPEELKDLDLYIGTFSMMGTTKRSFESLTKASLANTTGLMVNQQMVTGNDYRTLKDQKLVISTKCLEANLDQAMGLLSELSTAHVVDDQTMLKYLVDQQYSGTEYYLMNSGDDVAWDELSKNLAPKYQAAYNEKKGALAYYKKLSDNWTQEGPKLVERLKNIQKKVMNKNGLMVSVTGESGSMAAVEKQVGALASSLSNEKQVNQIPIFKATKESKAVAMPSQVQYVYKGFNASQVGEKVTGSTLVFTQLLNNEYMYPMIRVQGGAYGGNAFAQLNGNVIFSSYRDPGLSETVKSIDQVVPVLKSLKLTQEQINPYINATLGGFDKPMSVFDIAQTEEARYLTGITAEQEEALLKEIIQTSPADLQAYIILLEKGFKEASLIVTGSEEQIQKNKVLFTDIKKANE